MTFERGFETDPMGSYLESLDRVRDARARSSSCPATGRRSATAPGRAASISRNKLRRLTQIREMVEARERTVTELTAELFPTVTDGGAAALRDGGDPRLPRLPRGARGPGAGATTGRGVRVAAGGI